MSPNHVETTWRPPRGCIFETAVKPTQYNLYDWLLQWNRKYTPGFLKAPRGVTSSGVVALTRQHCDCLVDWKVRGRVLWVVGYTCFMNPRWWPSDEWNTTQNNNPLSDRTNFLKQMHFSNEDNLSLRPLPLHGISSNQSMVRIFVCLFVSVGTLPELYFFCRCFLLLLLLVFLLLSFFGFVFGVFLCFLLLFFFAFE